MTLFENFVDGLMEEEYQQIVQKSQESGRQSVANEVVQTHSDSLIRELEDLTREISVLEFQYMFQRIISNLDGKFGEYLANQKGIIVNTGELEAELSRKFKAKSDQMPPQVDIKQEYKTATETQLKQFKLSNYI